MSSSSISANNSIMSSQAQSDISKMQSMQKSMTKVLSEKDEKRLKESCQEFEAIFVSELLKSMRATIPKGGMMGENFGQDVFQSMLDDEYSKKVSETKSIGLADMMFQQMKMNMAIAQGNS
ncbi:MAG: rod-binding protein [Ignavibacteriales bacterium]